MSVVIETPRSPRSRKGAKYERWAWLYMRFSGLALLFLIFGHLFINLYMNGGIQQISFAFVAGKWADPFWQIWDGAMLWLALIHGTNGMRTLVNDYAEREKIRKMLNVTLWVVCGALLVLGTLVVTTFDPCVDPAVFDMEQLQQFCPAR
jgi:succinate dehydrogenase / fumarate reductase membrane anchor subunit